MVLSSFGQSAGTLTVAWSPSGDAGIVGYNLYCAQQTGTYTNVTSLGNVTNATVQGLTAGQTYHFAVTAVNSHGIESLLSNEISYTISNTAPSILNTPPVISSVPDQVLTANSITLPVPFTVGDLETPDHLAISAVSSNPALLPNQNIALSASGTNCSMVLTPALGQTGTASVALTVCDPTLCTTTTFQVTVNPLPAITVTAPGNGTSYTAPVDIGLAASVTSNGHKITQVQFYNGQALLGTVAASPYMLNWPSVSAGSYTIVASLVYDNSQIVVSAPCTFTVTPAPAIPLPWQTADIGSPGIVGGVGITNGTFSIQGAGTITSSADTFRFVYQNLSGDGEIRAQISSLQKVSGSSISGVMIRESLTGSSRYALLGVQPTGTIRWQRRTSTSGGCSSSRCGDSSFPNVWLRVVRTGNTLSGYKSVDGVKWTLVNACTVNMASDIYVGLAVASGSLTTLASSVCNNVTVVP